MPRQLLCFALGAVALTPLPLAPQSQELTRIDALIARSRFTEARAALQQWQTVGSRKPAPDDVAYGLALRARLATRADSALAAWLELALAHPSSRHAPDALLRLGQGYAALGQHERAAGWLERIPRDHPGFPRRHLAVAWLARAQRAAGRAAAACATLAAVRTQGGIDSASRQLIEAEWSKCETASQVTRPPGAERPEASRSAAARGGAPPRAAQVEQPRALPSPPADEEGRYTIQIGAFRRRDAAVALARRLREQNIPARIVIMSDGALNLVRAGRFHTSAEAAPLLRRVRAVVPAAVLAADAHREAGASR